MAYISKNKKIVTNLDALDFLRAALMRAREAGIEYILSDKTTFDTDDLDCYPRGIRLILSRSSSEWTLLKILEEEFEWLKIDKRSGRMSINPNQSIHHRLTEYGFQQTVVNLLNQSGIDCYADVNWRE